MAVSTEFALTDLNNSSNTQQVLFLNNAQLFVQRNMYISREYCFILCFFLFLLNCVVLLVFNQLDASLSVGKVYRKLGRALVFFLNKALRFVWAPLVLCIESV